MGYSAQDRRLIESGAEASAIIIVDAFHFDVAKAIDPLSPAGFVRIQNQFTKQLSKISLPIEKKHIDRALNRLDVDWPNLTEAQQSAAVKAANKALLPLEKKIPIATAPTIETQTNRMVKGTRQAVRRKEKLKIEASLNETDKRIAEFVSSSQKGFVRDEFGRRRTQFSKRARAIVSEGLQKGLGRKDIAEDLERRLGFNPKKSRNYWEVVAGAFANRARTWAQLSSFDEAGIERYVFEAVLDRATTEVCRFMHGKKFSVGGGLGKFREVERKRNPEAIKSVTPWVRTVTNQDGDRVLAFERDGKQTEVATIEESAVGQADEIGRFSGGMSNEALHSNGLTMPPLHGMCRSTVVPA